MSSWCYNLDSIDKIENTFKALAVYPFEKSVI